MSIFLSKIFTYNFLVVNSRKLRFLLSKCGLNVIVNCSTSEKASKCTYNFFPNQMLIYDNIMGRLWIELELVLIVIQFFIHSCFVNGHSHLRKFFKEGNMLYKKK